MSYRLYKKRKINVNRNNIMFFSLFFLLSILLLSIVIAGFPKNNGEVTAKNSVPKFSIKPNDIVFDDKNGGGPKIKVYISSEDNIVELNLEEYVRGVVSGEMPAEFSFEAIKAQAVAARTFGLAHMSLYGGHPYNGAKGADVTDTVECQVYLDKDKRIASWPVSKQGEYWNKITKAVTDTEGEVLTYNGDLVLNPYFFSTSSGKTENSIDVFSFDEPYLKSVDSPGENISPRYVNKFTFSYSDFVKKMNEGIPGSNLKVSNLKDSVKILKRSSPNGVVQSVKAGSKTVEGTKLRWILGLSSYSYTFKFDGKQVIVTSLGYGHGVGMSQWGANAMAKSGSDYKKILTHYYTGVKIEKLKY